MNATNLPEPDELPLGPLSARMEETYPGGYIIQSASNRALIAKHIIAAAHAHSGTRGVGAIVDRVQSQRGGPTPDQIWENFIARKEGARLFPETWNAGMAIKRPFFGLPLLEVGLPVRFKAVTFSMDYVFGRRVKSSFSIDEFGNVYLPKQLNENGPTGLQIAQEAVQAAKREDPTFVEYGINNRMPPETEAKVNPSYIQLCRLRQKEERKNTHEQAGASISSEARCEVTVAQILEIATILSRIAAGPLGRLNPILYTDAEFTPAMGPRPCKYGSPLFPACNVFHIEVQPTGHVLSFVTDEGCALRFSGLAGVRFPDGTIVNADTSPNWDCGEEMADGRCSLGVSDTVFPDELKPRFAEAVRRAQEAYNERMQRKSPAEIEVTKSDAVSEGQGESV